jgi:hypothetical protein
VSQAPEVEPEHVAPSASEVTDSVAPAESAVDGPPASDQPEAGDHSATSASEAQASSATAVDPRVDDALSRLAELDTLPLTEQVEVYTDIHRRLAGVLADPDSQA